MNVYIVRHGETTLNINKIHQLPTTTLSSKGVQQIKKISTYLASLNINIIYTSHLTRAKQTASIIGDILDVNILTAPELEEIRRPSEIIGKKHNESKALKIKQTIRENYHKLQWHYSDEENFSDVKMRTDRFIQFLTNQDESKNILIITHGYITKMFLALVILGNELTPKTYLEFYDKVKITNASLTKLEHSKLNGWHIDYWNLTIPFS